MNEQTEWMGQFFKALTSKQISRNKNFAALSGGWSRLVHQRFQVISGLKREAERLARFPGSSCWISPDGEGLLFHLECPRMHYKRVIALRGYEWDWLGRQDGVRAILAMTTLEN